MERMQQACDREFCLPCALQMLLFIPVIQVATVIGTGERDPEPPVPDYL